MKSKACAAHDESAKTQSIGETLEAPISLSPEQLQSVAAGLSLSPGRGLIWGLIWKGAVNPVETVGTPSINLGNVFKGGAPSQF